MNTLILIIHAVVVCSLTLAALRIGKEGMIAWLSLLAITMNLFVLKQINLFGLSVTTSDALGVGYLLGLNLMQEYFGRSAARRTVWISLFISCAFLLLSQIHLWYQPNQFDHSQSHFMLLLQPMLRIIAASLFSFLVVQLIDLKFFAFLRSKTAGRYLTARTTLALLLSQTIDTLLFSFLALYGTVASITDIIVLSLCIKGIVIFLSAPFITFSKKVTPHVPI